MTEDQGQTQDGRKSLDFLFSFKGRITRGQFIAGLGVIVILMVCLVAAAANFMDSRGGFGLFIPITILLLIAIAWIHAALVVKRLRDAGRPGWHYFIFGLGPFLWVLASESFGSLWIAGPIVFLALLLSPAFFKTKTETPPT